jgi:hypothetical protein
LGFGEIQAIDLTHWKGNSRDPFFTDLCAAVSAKLEGRAVPPAKGPMKRLIRRLTYSSVASAIGFGALAFGFNLFSAQDQVCGIPLLQPHISDVHGLHPSQRMARTPTTPPRYARRSREARDLNSASGGGGASTNRAGARHRTWSG